MAFFEVQLWLPFRRPSLAEKIRRWTSSPVLLSSIRQAVLRAREFWVEAVGVSRQGCTVRRHRLQPREGLRVLKHKRKSRSVVATERLWGDLLRQRFYGEYFIKLDRRFATRRIDDGREFDVAGDWDLRRVLWNWWRSYRVGVC